MGVEHAGAVSGDNEAVEVTTSVGDAVDDVEVAGLAPHEDSTAAASSAEEEPRLEAVPAAANCSLEFANCVR